MKKIIVVMIIGMLMGCGGVKVVKQGCCQETLIENMVGERTMARLRGAIFINPDLSDEEMERIIGAEKMKELLEQL